MLNTNYSHNKYTKSLLFVASDCKIYFPFRKEKSPGRLVIRGFSVQVSEKSVGAENGIRTRDPQLGKLMLYQLSYFREVSVSLGVGVGVICWLQI